jgi:membrane-bound ClpP family serine protease
MDNMTIAYLLMLVGLVLLVAEVFLPTHGILAVLALAALIVAVTLAFNEGTYSGLTALLMVFVAISVVGILFVNIWPRTPLSRPFFLQAPEDDTIAHHPAYKDLELLKGRFGRTISALRPAGITDFDGRRIDTLSEGSLIAAGQWVQCIDVHAGKVIVRQIEAPPDLENMDTATLG